MGVGVAFALRNKGDDMAKIHAFIEVSRIKWEWWATVRIDPDERLFELMAKDPKGLPEDMGEQVLHARGLYCNENWAAYQSLITRKDLIEIRKSINYWNLISPVWTDNHVEDMLAANGLKVKIDDAGWLTFPELNRIQMAYMLDDNDPNLDISAICALMDELDKRVGEMRLVFWFDG